MRKIIPVILCLTMLLPLCACEQGKEIKLLENTDYEDGATTLYYFDGETTYYKFVFDTDEEKKIVESINELKAREVDPSKAKEITIPCYGISTYNKSGYEVKLTYGNGYWLMQDGSVYKAKYDLASLYDSFPPEDSDPYKGGIWFPNSAWLGPYDVRFYRKESDMPGEKDGMSLSLVDLKGKTATVRFTNNSEYEYVFGEDYSLQKLIDGEWYTLSTKEDICFNAMGYHVDPGASRDMDCDLTPYGELEEGSYRIAKGCFIFREDSPKQDEDTMLVAEFKI